MEDDVSDRASNTNPSNLENCPFVGVRTVGGAVQIAGLAWDVSKSVYREGKTWTDGKLMWNVQMPLMRKLSNQTPALIARIPCSSEPSLFETESPNCESIGANAG